MPKVSLKEQRLRRIEKIELILEALEYFHKNDISEELGQPEDPLYVEIKEELTKERKINMDILQVDKTQIDRSIERFIPIDWHYYPYMVG